MHFKRFSLPEQARTAVARDLQGTLVDLIDLAMQTKQAHWNLTGREFQEIHEKLDENEAAYRTHIDNVAERMLMIGVAADGRSSTVSSTTGLPPFPEGEIAVAQAISQLADSLHTAIQHARERQGRIGELDAVTEDLLIGLINDLEMHLWMFQAQEAAHTERLQTA